MHVADFRDGLGAPAPAQESSAPDAKGFGIRSGGREMRSMDLAPVRHAIVEGRLTWQQHALQRLAERNLCREDVVQSILNGEVIEDYPDDYPLPSALVLCSREGRPVHVVVAWDAEDHRTYIITVYIPNEARFADDCRRRRTRNA
jgi:hypothetical protein